MAAYIEDMSDVLMSSDELMLKELERRDGIYSFIFHELDLPKNDPAANESKEVVVYDDADADYRIQQHLNSLLQSAPESEFTELNSAILVTTSINSAGGDEWTLTPIGHSSPLNSYLLSTLILTSMASGKQFECRPLSPTIMPDNAAALYSTPNQSSLVRLVNTNRLISKRDPLLSSSAIVSKSDYLAPSTVVQHTSAMKPLATVVQHTSAIRPLSTVVQHTDSLKGQPSEMPDYTDSSSSSSVWSPPTMWSNVDCFETSSTLSMGTESNSRPSSPMFPPSVPLSAQSPQVQRTETFIAPSTSTARQQTATLKRPSTEAYETYSMRPPKAVPQHTDSWQRPSMMQNCTVTQPGGYGTQSTSTWHHPVMPNNSIEAEKTVLPPIGTLRPLLNQSVPIASGASTSATAAATTWYEPPKVTPPSITWGNGFCWEPYKPAQTSRSATVTSASSTSSLQHECSQTIPNCPPPPYRPPSQHTEMPPPDYSAGTSFGKNKYGFMGDASYRFNVTHRLHAPAIGPGAPMVRNRQHYLKDTPEYKNFFKVFYKPAPNGTDFSTSMKIPDLRSLFPHDPDVHAPFKEAATHLLKTSSQTGGANNDGENF